MEYHDKFVEFSKYCKNCKYKDLDESQDPCDHCLEEPTNVDSHRPHRFEVSDNIVKVDLKRK